MSRYIKYFDNGGKNMSFMIKNDMVLIKYNKIWDKIKNIFQSIPVYDGKYIKVKVKEFNSVVNTNILDDEVPKEGLHHTCIACINIAFRRMQI